MDGQIYFELLVLTGIATGAILYLIAPLVLSGNAQVSAMRRTGMWLMVVAGTIAVMAILLLPRLVLIAPDRLP